MSNPLWFALVAALTLALAGCAPTAPSPSRSPESPAPGGATIAPMGRDDVRSKIATSFPIEVPVPSGELVRGQAQGAEAWDYEIVVDAPQADVVAWYRDAYLGRGWELAGERDMSTATSAGTELALRKGGAESRIVVFEEGTRSRVKAVLGVGAPVLEVQ